MIFVNGDNEWDFFGGGGWNWGGMGGPRGRLNYEGARPGRGAGRSVDDLPGDDCGCGVRVYRGSDLFSANAVFDLFKIGIGVMIKGFGWLRQERESSIQGKLVDFEFERQTPKGTAGRPRRRRSPLEKGISGRDRIDWMRSKSSRSPGGASCGIVGDFDGRRFCWRRNPVTRRRWRESSRRWRRARR